MEIFRFIAGAVFILAGLVVACIAVIGNYKFKFVLNRMHAAALNDTLGILFVLFGLIILNGWNFTSLKMFVLICFFSVVFFFIFFGFFWGVFDVWCL